MTTGITDPPAGFFSMFRTASSSKMAPSGRLDDNPCVDSTSRRTNADAPAITVCISRLISSRSSTHAVRESSSRRLNCRSRSASCAAYRCDSSAACLSRSAVARRWSSAESANLWSRSATCLRVSCSAAAARASAASARATAFAALVSASSSCALSAASSTSLRCLILVSSDATSSSRDFCAAETFRSHSAHTSAICASLSSTSACAVASSLLNVFVSTSRLDSSLSIPSIVLVRLSLSRCLSSSSARCDASNLGGFGLADLAESFGVNANRGRPESVACGVAATLALPLNLGGSPRLRRAILEAV
mmetsp:Transcript_6801/g.30659  ORF Transcript_6801/g.30659 Transcript_6801/m.30659 type:complete len:306 (-) Transcript_6801:143-1060(-)